MTQAGWVQQIAGWRPPEQLLEVRLSLQGVVQGLPHAEALQPIELEQRLNLVLCPVPVMPAGGRTVDGLCPATRKCEGPCRQGEKATMQFRTS